MVSGGRWSLIGGVSGGRGSWWEVVSGGRWSLIYRRGSLVGGGLGGRWSLVEGGLW